MVRICRFVKKVTDSTTRVALTLSFMYAPISEGDLTARVSHTAPWESW